MKSKKWIKDQIKDCRSAVGTLSFATRNKLMVKKMFSDVPMLDYNVLDALIQKSKYLETIKILTEILK